MVIIFQKSMAFFVWIYYTINNQSLFGGVFVIKLPENTQIMKIEEFLNREGYLHKISEEIKLYIENDNYHKLYSIYGIGGIGKTEFSKKVKLENENEIEIEIINLLAKIDDDLDLLLKIRKKYKNAPDFDYLFLQYWSTHKITELNGDYKKMLEKNIFNALKKAEVLEDVQKAKIFDFINKIGFKEPYASKINRNLNNLSSLFNEYSCYFDVSKWGSMIRLSNYIYSICSDKFNEKKHENILEKIEDENFINTLFGILIKNINEYNNKKIVLIFDGLNIDKEEEFFESILEFSLHIKNGLFIVITRNQKNYSIYKDKYPNIIEEIKIDELPEKIVHKYLNNDKFKFDTNLIEHIITKTQCIPFFLELAIYNVKNSKFADYSDIFRCRYKEDFVKRYQDNLTEYQKVFFSIFSVVKMFNKEIFNAFMKGPNFTFSFNQYTTIDYVEKIENYNVFIIKDIFAENYKQIDEIDENEIIEKYVNVFYKRILPIESPQIVHLFINNVIDLLFDKNNYIGFDNIENILLDIILYSNDTGYIVELNKKLELCNTTDNKIKNLFYFSNALAKREINIKYGLDEFNKIVYEIMSEKFNKIVKLEQFYITSIYGDYDAAMIEFKKIFESFNKDEKNEHYYLKALLYYADILMLKGLFKQAKSILVDRFEDLERIQSYQNFRTIYDIHKAVGHMNRFNFYLSEAELEYSHVTFKTSEKIKAYRSTVLCETYCFYRSTQFLQEYEEAKSLNDFIGSKNNLAKIHYSNAIALIHKKKFDEANEYYNKSLDMNKSSGYKAGEVFAHIAKCYIDYAEKGAIDATIVQTLERIVYELGVYEYLLLPIYVMKNDENKIEKLKQYQWFNFELTIDYIKMFLNKIKS